MRHSLCCDNGLRSETIFFKNDPRQKYRNKLETVRTSVVNTERGPPHVIKDGSR